MVVAQEQETWLGQEEEVVAALGQADGHRQVEAEAVRALHSGWRLFTLVSSANTE